MFRVCWVHPSGRLLYRVQARDHDPVYALNHALDHAPSHTPYHAPDQATYHAPDHTNHSIAYMSTQTVQNSL